MAISEYLPTHRMSELITDNSLLLMVMSRFGVSLGFGEKTVEEVCRHHGVHCKTFLAVANFVSRKKFSADDVDPASLINYLKRAHSYFLDFYLPQIRRKLIEAIDCSVGDHLAFLILKFYDEYVTEVRRHMEYENTTVFAYVENLLRGVADESFNIRVFLSNHGHIDAKLKELKTIIVRYYPQKENDLLNAVLFDIINCEQDLKSHCRVEDRLFVPVVEKLEENATSITPADARPAAAAGADQSKLEVLSQREKEIVECVAKGMSNKEIADSLCLSIHTVTTHRRNISQKLEIHTPAGLTIFAIANGLVNIRDIRMQ